MPILGFYECPNLADVFSHALYSKNLFCHGQLGRKVPGTAHILPIMTDFLQIFAVGGKVSHRVGLQPNVTSHPQ